LVRARVVAPVLELVVVRAAALVLATEPAVEARAVVSALVTESELVTVMDLVEAQVVVAIHHRYPDLLPASQQDPAPHMPNRYCLMVKDV
jgi:phosphopantothenate synthetase